MMSRYPYETRVRNERIVLRLKVAVIVILLLCGWVLILTPCPSGTFC